MALMCEDGGGLKSRGQRQGVESPSVTLADVLRGGDHWYSWRAVKSVTWVSV